MAENRRLLSENEKSLIEATKKKDIDEVKKFLKNDDVRVDCLDENGMSPLQHAAYYGSRELCEVLVDHGADINLNEHDHKYTALMFASLSGKSDCVSFLLENGATTSVTNSIGRTASQMAAFVSNHEIVSLINNFLPKEEIEYFTKPQGLEKEPKLPIFLATPIYKLLLKTNIHPVKIAMYLEQNLVLINNYEKISKVLEAISERLVKNSGDSNEILILKIHHINCVIKACGKNFNEEKKLNALIKSWIKTDSGFPIGLESFLRQSVRDFPFHESVLFQQLVRTLSPVKIGSEPSAYSILMSAICGQRSMADSNDVCSTCGEPKSVKKCSSCKATLYCDQNCQKLHWFVHKKECAKLAEEKLLELEKVKISENEKPIEGEASTVST